VTPLDQLRMHVVIPVVVADDRDCAVSLGDALVAGGLPVAEVTFRTQVAPDVIRVLAQRGDILVGAGTVLTAAQVDTAVEAGAAFMLCRRALAAPWLIGVLSAACCRYRAR
jgi:2-dehydro-3-deoxyphosphogluconate aldolase/(4S)-4-hydroxy-2-oxoglutarate aldolase